MQSVECPQQNSDLKKQLFDELSSRNDCRVRQLQIDVRRDRCVLQGTASSYYVKQLAQSIVLRARPDVCLVNEITVRSLK